MSFCADNKKILLAKGEAFPQPSPMMRRFFFRKSFPTFLVLGAAFAAGADDAKMDWQPSGVSSKAGYYRPLHLVLSPDKPDGIKVLPADLAAPLYGKLQLGPAEVPHLAAAYEKFHAKGFEVLGVSLDQANSSEKLAQFTKENHMPWPEVYDGKYWSAAVPQKYFIESIPHAFLVDGSTGLIVAGGEELREEGLSPNIEKALAKHQE
jgi:hypothetical protein